MTPEAPASLQSCGPHTWGVLKGHGRAEAADTAADLEDLDGQPDSEKTALRSNLGASLETITTTTPVLKLVPT